MDIHCEAEAMGITQQVIDPEYTPDPCVHRSVVYLNSSIIDSLPADIENTSITPGTNINPTRLIFPVQRDLSALTEEDQKDMLMDFLKPKTPCNII